MTRALFLLIALSVPSNAQEPVSQTTEGRLWLRIPEGSAPLQNIQVSSGTATPAPWEKDVEVSKRLTDVVFPVRWWDWKEIIIRFTPIEDGSVDLVLNGPWEEANPGVITRKEVLWDGITAEGTAVENGGFETWSDDKPGGWKPLYQDYPAQESWPLTKVAAYEGKSVAASWQNRPLAQTLPLKAGQKVTLRLHVQAATLPGFTPPKLLGQNTPAHRVLARIKRGVNLGNCWDAPPPYSWGIRYTSEDIDRIAAEGFDHIRVPVAWSHHLKQIGDHYEIDPAILTDLEPVLRRALEKRMHVLLDWHHFDALTTDPQSSRARFVASWEAIARHFKSWPSGLFLELLNEPRDALTTEVANPIYAETIAAIRKIDPERIIFVSPGKWGDSRELDKLRLPDSDDRVVVTVHCYEPFYYTHQGADWVKLSGLRGITYPGPPATPLILPETYQNDAGIRDFVKGYNTLPADRNPCSASQIRELLDLAREWSVHFGRPIHLGEFGSHNVSDQASRNRYSHDVRTLAEERKIPWSLWDWKAGFAYWDSKNNQPYLRSALFD